MSSSLCHVTAVPLFTIKRGGSNVKLSIFTVASAARAGAEKKKGAANACPARDMRGAAAAPRDAAEETARRNARLVVIELALIARLRERLIDHGEPLLVLLEDHVRAAEQRAQLVVRDLH